MNKRLKNKADKARRREIHALLDTALDINGLFPRKREKTGDLPTVFIEFSGHIGMFYLGVHDHGWIPDKCPDLYKPTKAADSNGISQLAGELRERYL